MASTKQSGPATDRHPFLLPIEDVAKQLDVSIETGLTARKVAELQKICPPNELVGGGGIAWYKILLKQISNAMILVGRETHLTPQLNIMYHSVNTIEYRSSSSPWL